MKTFRSSRDERGAMMLIAVFFAIFAVALLYYLLGISATLLFREKLQDTADSAALSAAIMHARGMNFIVLLNIVMAALLAVLVTLKLVETLAIIGIAIAGALAWATFGATLAFIPPLNQVRSKMQDAYDQMKTPIFRALRALHSTADAVRDVVPIAATGLVMADIEANSNPRGARGGAFGPQLTLPVTDDSFDELCGRAGELPIKLAEAALNKVHLSGTISWLEAPMHSLTESMSGWFCGDDSSPQSYSQEVDQGYPHTELAATCEQQGQKEQNEARTKQLCDDANADETAARPDETTGACQENCTTDGPYDKHVKLAREQCDPTQESPPNRYKYQKRAGTADYLWKSNHWVRGEAKYEPPVKGASEGRPPCGPEYLMPTEAVGYNKTVRARANFDEVLPVCSTDRAPVLNGSKDGDVIVVHFTEVTQILGCERHEKRQIPIETPDSKTRGDSESSDESSQQSKSPKKIEASVDADTFQIRALVQGHVNTIAGDRVIMLSLWNNDAPQDALSNFRSLGDYSFAQAEYFYDADGNPSDKMWNMNWRARLRRFRLPHGNRFMEEAHKHLGNSYDSLIDRLHSFRSLVVH